MMTRNLRKGVGKTDVRDVAERVAEITERDNDAAVRAVVRWALRVHIGPTCEILGLDLRGALTRARRRSRLNAE
jgi:hypothetical protein